MRFSTILVLRRNLTTSEPRPPQVLPSHWLGGGDVLIATATAVALCCWFALYKWYGLESYASTPHFAFDKVPGHFDSPILRYTALIFVELGLVYLVGYWLIRDAVRITAVMKLAIVVLVSGAAVINVFIYPVGALDVFNYIIELELAYHYQQNPYLVTFRAYASDPLARFAFFLDTPLFYGPAWLRMSWVPALVGFVDVLRILVALKVFNVVLLAMTAAAVYAYHEDERRRWLAVYAFAANPLVLFEGVGNAHNDVMGALFLVAALLALKRRSMLSLPFGFLSAMVKLFTLPLLLLLLVVMIRQRWSRRRITGAVVSTALLGVVLCGPYWGGGAMLSSLRRGMLSSQEMYSTSVVSLLREYLQHVPVSAYAAISVRNVLLAVFAAAALLLLWRVWRGMSVVRAMVDTYLLFAVLASLLYPWYLIPAIAVLVLRPQALDGTFLVSVSIFGLVYYPLSVWAVFDANMTTFQIHLFQALFLLPPIAALLVLDLYRSVVDRQLAPATGRALWLMAANAVAAALVLAHAFLVPMAAVASAVSPDASYEAAGGVSLMPRREETPRPPAGYAT